MASAVVSLGIIIAEDWVAAALWQFEGGSTKVLSHSAPFILPSDSDTSRNEAVDQALEALGDAGLSAKDVLFVLPHHWIKDGEVVSEKKRFLKQLSQDLVLSPLGFVLLSDTIIAAEQTDHNREFSGLLLIESATGWDALVYDRGSEQKVERVGKSGDLSADLQELQARFQGVEFGRLLVVPAGTSTEAEPTLSGLEKTFSRSNELITREQLVELATRLGGQEVMQPPAETENTETEAPARNPDLPLMNPAPPGFQTPSFAKGTEAPPENEKSTTGFTIRGNYQPSPEEELESSESDSAPEPETALSEITETHSKPAIWAGIGTTLQAQLKNLSGLFSGKKGKMGTRNPVILGGGAAVLALFLLAGGVYAYGQQSYRSEITLWLRSTPLELTQEFPITTGTASQTGTLTAEVLTESVTVDKEVPTTGTKIIGDPAKGKVTLYNKTSQPKTFPSGTKLTVDKMIFTLDGEVQIASSSAINGGIMFGAADTNVTAVAIGPEGNIGKEKTFTVANFDTSSYEAKNKEALSGGSKREIQAVAQKDIDTATRELQTAAKEQLRATITNQASDTALVFFTETTRTTSTEVSTKIGEEAKFVQVKIKVEGSGLRIGREVVEAAGQELFANKVPSDSHLLPESVALVPDTITTASGSGTLRINATLRAQTVKQVSASAVQQALKGAYLGRVTVITQEQFGVSRSEMKIEPAWLRWMFTRLPSDPERIQVNVRIDQSQ